MICTSAHASAPHVGHAYRLASLSKFLKMTAYVPDNYQLGVRSLCSMCLLLGCCASRYSVECDMSRAVCRDQGLADVSRAVYEVTFLIPDVAGCAGAPLSHR